MNKIKEFFKSILGQNSPKEKFVTVTTYTGAKLPEKQSSPAPFKRSFQILTKRPENMSFEAYKQHLAKQRHWLKERKKGFLVYIAAEIIKKEVSKKGTNEKETVYERLTYMPFVGSAKTDLVKPV